MFIFGGFLNLVTQRLSNIVVTVGVTFGFQPSKYTVFEHEEVMSLCVLIVNTSDTLTSGLRTPIELILDTKDDTTAGN